MVARLGFATHQLLTEILELATHLCHLFSRHIARLGGIWYSPISIHQFRSRRQQKTTRQQPKPQELNTAAPLKPLSRSHTTLKCSGLGETGYLYTEENDANGIAGDVNTSAYRERGKATMSSIEEVWEETRGISPPDVIPMWGQMKASGDCCGFKTTKDSETSW